MKLRNALRILSDNFSCVYKLLLYRAIVGIVFFGIAYALLNFGLHTIFASEQVQAVGVLIGDFFEALFSGQADYLGTFRDTFSEAMRNLLVMLAENINPIVGTGAGICLVYLLQRLLNGVAVVAMGNIYHDRMRSYSKTSFSAAFFKHLGQALLYQIIYVPVSFLYDVAAILCCWFFFFYTPSLLSALGLVSVLVGLSLSLALFLCLQSLKMTLISAWIPALTSGQSVIGGLKECFGGLKRGFGKRYSCFLISVYLIVILNIACGLCTLGSALFISIPASYLFLLVVQFVCYYDENGKKYYISLHEIVGADEEPEDLISSEESDL